MADLLDDYLAEERRRAFEWSSLRNGDCQLFLVGWAERIGWPQAGWPWRGRYGCEDEARALLDQCGGAVAAWTDLLGPPRLGSAPRRGDVGLLACDGWHFGLICTGSMWILRAGARGILHTRRSPDVTWDLRFS